MNSEELIKNLEQYFNYIKAVFLKDYSKFLCESKRNKIEMSSNIFKIEEDAKFKIIVSDKITIGLDIEEYILENSLSSDKNLRDIHIDGKIFIKYLIDNKNNVDKLILSLILKPIITYFIGKDDNVIMKGFIDLITQSIEKKYNITYKKPYPSKELELALEIMKIVGEDIYYGSLFNGNIKLLELEYNKKINSEIDDNPFLTIYEELDKIYNTYYGRIGKVYVPDSLYDYQSLDYSVFFEHLNKNNEVMENKKNNKVLRIESAKKSLENILSHRISFEQLEQLQISNALIEINNMLENINDDNIDFLYKKTLQIEEKILPISKRLWDKTLMHPLSYTEGKSFQFLIGSVDNEIIKEAKLLTDYHLKNIELNPKISYGFIYKVNPDEIIYTISSDAITKVVNSYDNSEMVIEYKDVKIEIDNQSDSRLLTPELLLKENIKSKNYNGKILLYKPIPYGVFVIYEGNYNNDYNKALQLSENYELPFVPINRSLYHLNNLGKEVIKKNDNIVKKQVKLKEIKKAPKESFLDKIKKIKNNLLYDDNENVEEFKKTL